MQMKSMKKLSYLLTIAACMLGGVAVAQKKSKGFVSLFDGKTLNDWKVGDNAASFTVDSGMIIAHGDVAHLFYDGKVGDHNFTNFHFKAEVKTTPGSNSGIYFHTAFQQGGWPSKGYEVQVNNSHTDWRRTGSLYAVQDVKEVFVKDNEWYTEEIIVQGKKVTTKINGKTVVEYTEPDNVKRSDDMKGRVLSSGTFALQGHDPNSKVYYRNIQVKILP
ncbi:hypothetical protein ABIE54_003085 [Chitinophagaceae bacterium OAS944]